MIYPIKFSNLILILIFDWIQSTHSYLFCLFNASWTALASTLTLRANSLYLSLISASPSFFFLLCSSQASSISFCFFSSRARYFSSPPLTMASIFLYFILISWSCSNFSSASLSRKSSTAASFSCYKRSSCYLHSSSIAFTRSALMLCQSKLSDDTMISGDYYKILQILDQLLSFTVKSL